MSDGSSKGLADREAVAVFPSAEALVNAADALQSQGVDRARLSILGVGTSQEAAALESAGFRTVRDVLSTADVPRSAYVQPEDVVTARSGLISILVYVGATLGAAIASATAGPVLAPIIAAALASGAAGGTAGAFLLHRLGGRPETYIHQSLEHGGLVLWVLLRNDEREVVEILRRGGAKEVMVQKVPLEMTAVSGPADRS